jgi:hypothetical protein
LRRYPAQRIVVAVVAVGLYAFLIDVVLALATLAGTTALLWVWFRWLAGWATQTSGAEHVPPARSLRGIGLDARPDPNLGPPSTSPAARAEIAELEALWNLPHGGRSDPP